VETAVRIRHIPTGLAVKCTQERSQGLNKQLGAFTYVLIVTRILPCSTCACVNLHDDGDAAFKRLKEKLISVLQEQRVKAVQDIRGDLVEAAWGYQVGANGVHASICTCIST
jgi:peptide chain release factor 2